MFEREFSQLATTIRDAVTKVREAKSIVTRRQVRVRRRDFSLKFRPDLGFASFAPERIEEDIWDWREQERFQDSVVKGLDEYKSLEAALGPKAGSAEGFARAVSFASFHGLDDKELMDLVSASARELEGRPLPVKVTAFIDGLSISESPLVLSDRFSLRQPTPEDVAEYIVLDEYGSFPFPLSEAWFCVVGDFVFDAINTGPAQMEFLRTLDALRLFRVGGIAANRYVMSSRHSFLNGGRMILGGLARRSPFTYTLSNSDVATLNRFLRDFVPRLPDPSHLNVATTESEIAYARYSDALFQDGPSERAITSAMTALEALFLEGETELTHRLAQRVSLLLRVLGTQPDAQGTYDNVKKGYKIRSIFIHGGSLAAKDRPQADSLAPVVLEYARECVLAFFQLATPKGELLKQIDRAMIDRVGVSQLEASLTPVAHR
jgi:hypothetical protein